MNNSLIKNNNTHNHYTSCNELRRLALRMQRSIGKVEDISVNASIVASQTGNQARVFFEISSQIEKTSRKMHTKINMLLDVINKLIENVLSSKIAQQRINYFTQTTLSQNQPANFQLIETVKERLKRQVARGSFQLVNGVNAIESHFSAFEFLINRIFVALTALRVEEELFRNQLKLATVDSLIKSFEKLLTNLSEDYDAFRDYFTLFKYINKHLLQEREI
ncbi:hypothetical protein [Legionella drancourtii]|uniref:Chemotaxis protein n=1 Tax=Legionella drancourtii LLAP12 TaxID=658187 RepID=G9EL36_9GAMM|nr:hypothetical protein [Legionella drancourtii]EHL31925.1 hypothetical protein LDG_6092 [Legionella drancourtii LLAP12]